MSAFEKYQTFIVGVIGFIGVIYTIRMNAKLAREQHIRELKHEANSVRIALVEELNLLVSSYKDRIEMLTNSNRKGSACFPVHVHNQAYQQLLPKIGSLSPNEIQELMLAYQLASELPNKLLFLAVNDNHGNLEVHNSNYDFVIKLHENFLVDMQNAVDVLKANLND